jgi:hypothetical protein
LPLKRGNSLKINVFQAFALQDGASRKLGRAPGTSSVRNICRSFRYFFRSVLAQRDIVKPDNERRSAGVVMPTDPFPTIPRWKFPKWQPQFQDAILEFDPRKSPALLEAAAAAIFTRLQSQDAGSEERRALANALRSIRAIQSKRLDRRGDRQQKRCA